jgi:MFS family permease
VLERFYRFFRELDNRVRVTIVGSGILSVGQRFAMQYRQLFIQALGANPVEQGLLNSIGTAIGSFVSIPLGWLVDRYGVKKIMLLGLVFAASSAALYASADNWWILIPAVILASEVRFNPLTDIVFITATKPEQRATVMSVARVIWDILRAFTPMIAAVVVVTFGGINAQGIRPLYYLQLAMAVFVFLLLAVKLQPLPPGIDRRTEKATLQKGVRARVRAFFLDFRELFKGETALKRWVVLRLVRNFAMRLAVPFSPLWMVDMKGATPQILGLMGTVSTVASLLLQIPAGRLSDQIGRKKTYFLLRPIAYLGTVLLILAPRPEYLILVGLLGAVGVGGGAGSGIGGVSFTPFITMQWEMVPKEKRGRWFGVEGLCNLATVPASILGGILWQQGFMTEVLLLPVLIEALVVTPILITVPDTLGRTDR